jgi:hypothetical protein
MVRVPAVVKLVVKVAVPLEPTLALPSISVPSRNVTVPVGVLAPEAPS